jgi:hypothetical protein
MKHIKSFDQFINESVNEGAEQKLAKKLAYLFGKKLPPDMFYEYLEDYSKSEPGDEYDWKQEDIDIFIDAFSEIKQEGLGMTNLNTSQVKSSKLYKAYLKESVNEGGYDPIDHEIVMSVLDVAAMYTSDANPAANQQWSSIADLAKYIKGDHIPKKYWKSFDASVEQIKKRHNIKESVNEGKVMSKKDIQNLLKTLGGESEDDSAAWDIADGILYDTPGLEAGIKKHFGARDPQGWLANYI